MRTLTEMLPIIRAIQAQARTNEITTESDPVCDLINYISDYGMQRFSEGVTIASKKYDYTSSPQLSHQ